MDIAGYLGEIQAKFASGQATEHSYRAPLEALFRSIDPAIEVINEPKRSEGGMPDFLFQRDGVAFGWCEAKDIDKDVLKLKGYSVEQRKRYEAAYPNLLYTNGVDFEFIRDKQVIHHTSIADFMGGLGGLQPLPDKFDELERQLKLFAEQKPISIRSAQKLAEMMAGKAAIIKDEVGIALGEDAEFRSGLGRQFTTFKENLLPNLTPGEFADIYAETITYGMFAARLHDDQLDTFSRAEALEKLPKSNPFLRGLFQYIAGYDIPDRLRYVVDDLAEVLRASDPHSLFAEFGKFTARNDPFIHFYETFLAAYNPKKRKARGVWYTPEPVVDFIVRAVDDVLKTEFGIADGLADTGKVTVDWDTGETKERQARHHQEGCAPRANPRPGHGHGHVSGQDGADHCRPGESARTGQMVCLRGGRTAAAPARVRTADGELCHVPYEAGHAADRKRLQAQRQPAAPVRLADQCAGTCRARGEGFVLPATRRRSARRERGEAPDADYVRDWESAVFGRKCEQGRSHHEFDGSLQEGAGRQGKAERAQPQMDQ